MKIYTKSGDKGETSLLGGDRVKKYDLRINAYGTSDELNSWIGLIKDQPINQSYKDFLLDVQDRLFTIGSNLAGLNRIENDNSIEPEIKKELIALLSPADSNKDGRLSKDEITLAINSFFDGNDNFTVEKLYDLIDYYFDQN